MNVQTWEDDAACREIGVEAFFPTGHGAEFNAGIRNAKTICRRCPVREECLALALDIEGPYGPDKRGGVWGGLTAHERAALRPAAA
ncbi:WhiB family transcriptional regulator [Streptomyces sp. NPDC059447]|uniref:WhiB family transcriptional regulator n=1 Tax=Streptomyces sp. NPDC059447 TaxID=3346834 RepID=UPI00367E9028